MLPRVGLGFCAALCVTSAPSIVVAADGGRTASPPGAAEFFIEPKDGATIAPKSVMRFGLRNMKVAPAGSTEPNSGHHHLLIDTALPPLDQPIPLDANHIHYGKGQTEAEVVLTPGPHTLQLLLGDANHVPFDPPVMSPPIKVTVVGSKAPAEAPAKP